MVKILGAGGSYSHRTEASSFLIEKNIVVDAGNIVKGLGHMCCDLEHIFLTHTHFDHIVDLPFIIESYFECREKPLKIYALESNIKALKEYLFNWSIWPNFEQILNYNDQCQCVEMIPINYDETLKIDNIEITPIFANHTIETCGFKIKKENQSFLISGDTYLNNNLIDIINDDETVSALLVDISFSSEEEELALKSKHLTPRLLQNMLVSLERDDVTIYSYHHKPQYIEQIDKELEEMQLLKNGGKRLETGDILDLFTPKNKRASVKNLELYYNERVYLQNLFNLLQTVQGKSNLGVTLDAIVEHTMKLTHADEAMLYLINDLTRELECMVFYNHTLSIHENCLSNTQNLSLSELNSDELKPSVDFLSQLDSSDKHAYIYDEIYDTPDLGLNYIKEFDKRKHYSSKSMIIVPLVDHTNDQMIGIMQLVNKKNIYSENIHFDNYDLESAKTLSMQASIAIANSKK